MSVTVQEMPDKETLEAFLAGLHGQPMVVFNIEKGRFEWVHERPERTDSGEK